MKTTYAIFEGNIDRLEKKLVTIANKCKKYGCTFDYRRVGEEYREVEVDGEVMTLRFIVVEVEGVAKLNGWRFVASVEHTPKGNIIRSAAPEFEVPERYYTSSSVCEHCNTKRSRKDTFIVRNEETGEFKQVGKSCLKDFTNGLSAEDVARYLSYFDELVEGEAPSGAGRGDLYFDKKDVLLYMSETVRKFGYFKNVNYDYCEDPHYRSTSNRAGDYYLVEEQGWNPTPEFADKARKEMRAVNFNPRCSENVTIVDEALAWIATQQEDNNYIHNLRTACALDYVKHKQFGLLASLFAAYFRFKESEEARKIREANRQKEAKSEHQGVVGDKITVDEVDLKFVSCYEGVYGYSYLYRMTDANGNVYTWSTSNGFEDGKYALSGKVKAHTTYRGVKQTEVTRCKLSKIVIENVEQAVPSTDGNIDGEIAEALNMLYEEA